MKTPSLILSAVLASFALNATAGDLAVEVRGIAQAKGDVLIALYDKSDTWLKNALRQVKVAAQKGSITTQFKDLPEGNYAISLFHDENVNGRMDSNLMGIPLEPYGFSKDASGNFGPASFEDAKFSLPAGGVSIVINLRS